MAITIDWPTGVISVPQADITFVSGTLYELDTDWFRLQLRSLEASEEGMPWATTHSHNTEVTVAGTTFARQIEIVNGYSVQFTPDSQWTVRLVGSNNNIFDVENGILVQNQVQVIPSNSAGLINGDISSQIVEGTESVQGALRIILSALAGKVSGVTTTTERFRDTGDSKDRIVTTLDVNGNRTSVTIDSS